MLEIILAIVSGVFSGGISSLLFIQQERKSKDLDNEAKQSDEWHKLYAELHDELKARDEQYDADIKEKDAKIDSLYDQIKQYRDEKAQLSVKNTELEVRCTRAELLMCKVPGCAKREPQSGY